MSRGTVLNGRTRERGLVLVMVLWIVSALSIIVAGLTQSVREEARSTGLQRQRTVAGAVGDGAIQLALRELTLRTEPLLRTMTVELPYQGVPVQIEVMPLNGLIDINSAPAPLLSKLFAVAGGVPGLADQLAQAVVQQRSSPGPGGAVERFDAPEDLLRVPGIDYELYAKIAALVTADLRGSGKINPLAAPPGVLNVLSGGNAGTAERIQAARAAGDAGIDTSSLDTAFVDQSPIRRFRVRARVPLADGGWAIVSRHVDMTVRRADGLPWRTFYSSQGFEALPRKNS